MLIGSSRSGSDRITWRAWANASAQADRSSITGRGDPAGDPGSANGGTWPDGLFGRSGTVLGRSAVSLVREALMGICDDAVEFLRASNDYEAHNRQEGLDDLR